MILDTVVQPVLMHCASSGVILGYVSIQHQIVNTMLSIHLLCDLKNKDNPV